MRTCRWLASVALLCLLLPSAARGQVIVEQARNDVPVLRSIDRPALRQGETVELLFRGERLAGVQGLLCEAAELVQVVENDEKSARLKVRTAADAHRGVFPVHLLCEAGLSNPRMLLVDTLPQTAETEDNDTLEQAGEVAVPGGVSGVLAPAERDFFRFHAAAGQTLLFDLLADRLGSPVRGVLTLFDAFGREIQKAAVPPDDITPDVRLAHTFETTGTYTICVTDRTFQGGEFAAYHLRISRGRFAAAMFPLGGRRGETTKIELAGGSLRQPVVHAVELPESPPWRRSRLTIPDGDGVLLAPALFAVGDYPERLEQEPNDQQQQAESVSRPVTINGRIDRPRDRDCFRFGAKTGEVLTLTLFAASLGTPLDAVLTVRDAAGKAVAENDDTTVGERVPPVIRAADDAGLSDDPRIDLTVPADGQYTVEVRDLFDRGGKAYGYRLEICRQPQDFELLVQPGRVENSDPRSRQRRRNRQVMAQFDGGGGGALSIDRGGRGSLVVSAIRRGYAGEIELQFEGLPPHLAVQSTKILPGQNQVVVDLLADFDADMSASLVEVRGAAEVDGRRIERRARQPVVFSGLPLGAVSRHDLERVAVGISGRGAELALRATLDGPLTPGGEGRIKLELRRREGIAGDVAVAAVNLPSGLTLDGLTIPAGKTTAEAVLRATADATPGPRSLQIEGKLTLKGKDKKDNQDKQQPLVALAPLEVEIRPLAVVELLTQTLEIAPGGTARLEFRVERNGGEATPVMFEAARLPAGVALSEPTLAADADSLAMQLTASADVRPSPVPRIIPIKPVLVVAGDRLELPAQRLVLKIVKP